MPFHVFPCFCVVVPIWNTKGTLNRYLYEQPELVGNIDFRVVVARINRTKCSESPKGPFEALHFFVPWPILTSFATLEGEDRDKRRGKGRDGGEERRGREERWGKEERRGREERQGREDLHA